MYIHRTLEKHVFVVSPVNKGWAMKPNIDLQSLLSSRITIFTYFVNGNNTDFIVIYLQ